MIIKLNRKVGNVKAFVFTLCSCSIRNLTWLFIGIAFGEQLISSSIEYIVTGETFGHWFDSAFLFAVASLYFYFAYELGDFLLDLTLNAEVKQDNNKD
jgi:hypothetical protein